MATKGEKILGTLAGVAVGVYIANRIIKAKEIKAEDEWKSYMAGVVAGGAIGYGLSHLLGTPNDTVNYELLGRNGRTVYHGITLESRISNREAEHIRSGKVFWNMVISEARPRIEAMEVEKGLIKRDRPKYNIIHNC